MEGAPSMFPEVDVDGAVSGGRHGDVGDVEHEIADPVPEPFPA